MVKPIRFLFIAGFLYLPLLAQTGPLPQREDAYILDSGILVNQTSRRALIFSERVHVEDAASLRLVFKEALLGKAPRGGEETQIKITSLKDGAVQTLNQKSLKQWRNTSAYFNGNEVLVEIFADPQSGESRLQMKSVMVGLNLNNGQESICGPTDDRTLSTDAKTARIVPVGCTAWLIDDANHCFLSAGHCVGGTFEVVEFNVPLSSDSGVINHPDPDDQYPIDQTSVQWTQTVIGDDWCYFGTFPNSNTGLTPFQAQGEFFILADPPSTPGGETIRITGYGTTTGTQGTPLSWSQVQTTHNGDLTDVDGTILRYSVDTTGGDSGSAVLNEDTGFAIGIHTNAGCDINGGANQATSLLNAGLQNALANPLGVCAPPPALDISFPQGLPELIPPGGMDLPIQIDEINNGTLNPQTAMLVYDAGSGDVQVSLSSQGGNQYMASIPALECPSSFSFYLSAQATNGDGNQVTTLLPADAPEQRYNRSVASDFDQSFRDDFETDTGWTVENDGGLTDGAWERGLPQGFGLRADPPYDVDGEGSCYLTDNVMGNSDVDGGHTVLVSPVMDASGSDPYITYWRWWSDEGSATMDDTFVIEVSDDGGSTWTLLETIGPAVTGSWVFRSFRVADFVTPNDQFRIRFDVSDLGTGSIVEAGVDHVALYNTAQGFTCTTLCPLDLNGDNTVDESDFMVAVAAWGSGSAADLNQDGREDLLDLLHLRTNFGACP